MENFHPSDQDQLCFSNSMIFSNYHPQHLEEEQLSPIPMNSSGNVNFFMDALLAPPTGLSVGNVKGNCGRKRKRMEDKDVESPKETIHVRAKGGRATDSHSLAERVRRERIKERLRFLQDLVPGCYKTMGMAVMLDVVIDYVQSLQNQIEFLSLKLSTASMSPNDFNSEDNHIERLQGTNAYEAQEVERMIVRDGHEGPSYFNSPWSPMN